MNAAPPPPYDWRGYLADQEATIRSRVSLILFIGATLVPLFSWLDYVLYPGSFSRFLNYRLLAAGLCLVLLLINRRWNFGYRSHFLGVAGYYITGLAIIRMTIETNGYASYYYAGLNLVFLTFCTVLTIRVKYMALHCAVLYGLFLSLVIYYGGNGRLDIFLSNNMFMLATIAIILIASTANQNLRYNEYRLRSELKVVKGQLERYSKLLEISVAESEEKYRRVVENANEAIVVIQDDTVRFVNPKAAELFGYTQLALVGQPYAEMVHSEDRHTAVQWLQMQLETQAVPASHSFRIIDQGGQVRWLESRMARLAWEGRPAVLQLISDITTRRQAERDLQRLATAIEQAAESILIIGTDYTIGYVNPAFERISGYERLEVIGQRLHSLAGPGKDEESFEAMLRCLDQGAPWNGRLVSHRKDDSLCPLETTISPIRDEAGAITSFVVVGRDVTHEEHLQRQLIQAQKMEAIGTLAGGIAHDFNNMLQAILGYGELLAMDMPTHERGYREIGEIIGAARKGAELVQQLLTFSRKLESKKRPLNLNQEVQQVRMLLARTIPKMIDIELALAEEIHIVNADAVQIQQALMNLAVNAKDAMPEGGRLTIATANVTLDETFVQTHLDARPGEYVRLRITDSGHGMSPEVLEHIFEPFFSTKGPGRGTGLGLAMVYGIVSSHDGFIVCDSHPDQGTAFSIYLPAIQQEAEITYLQEIEASLLVGWETILLVDDESAIRDLSQQALTKAGYEVLTAEDGESALELYRREHERVDLVILDLIMPGMGGRRCLQELFTINPTVRVLVASGYAPEGAATAALADGARAFLRKPFEIMQLLKAVRNLLDAA
jgi:PAS domain S-box-containing protein